MFPAAISLGLTGLISSNQSDQIRLASLDFDGTTTFDLTNLPNQKQGNWTDYVLGVVHFLREKGVQIRGFDLLISSTLPKASGLSSSAALEVLIYYALQKEFSGSEPDRIQIALDCQQIENEFIGVNCGIMDQFAVANGKKDTCILLNCNSLEHQFVPLQLGDFSLLIINSNKPRTLANSAYNQRRKECEMALSQISVRRSIEHLVLAQEADLTHLSDEVLKKRTRHAFSEQNRVLAARKALETGDLIQFGQLLIQSHNSLKNDFEVSCTELDFVVEHLLESDGCVGARMTGAGFGGCCVALVQTEHIPTVSESLVLAYDEKFGYQPSVYPCQPSSGVRQLNND